MSFITDLVGRDIVNAPIVNAEMHRILDIDCAKNHPELEVDVSVVKCGFDVYKAQGGAYFSAPNVLILHKDVGDGAVEFHTYNGGTGHDLTAAAQAFFEQAAKAYDFAVTYYDNPKISGLFRFVTFPTTITDLGDGPGLKFKASVSLRERVQ